jgi:cation:H+ antiporter
VASTATVWLALLFAVCVAATWLAGNLLSSTTDVLDTRLGFGEDIGGIVLLAVAGSLPELAITISAAAAGNLPLAAGNLIGGIAVQTMVLVLCDVVAGERPLSFLVGRLTPVLEGLLVVLCVSGVLLGSLLNPSTTLFHGLSPASLAIVVVWAIGIYVINRTRKNTPWHVDMPGSQPGRHHRREHHPLHVRPFAERTTLAVGGMFGLACAVTLAAGVGLEEAGNELANRAGINGVIFGATVLATATALPEISSGIQAVRLGDNALAIGDIFGGNAFQVCLFVVADLVAGQAVLPTAGRLNSWLASIGVALTAVYAIGIIGRPFRCFARLGPDSLLAIVVFALGVAGMFVLPH